MITIEELRAKLDVLRFIHDCMAIKMNDMTTNMEAVKIQMQSMTLPPNPTLAEFSDNLRATYALSNEAAQNVGYTQAVHDLKYICDRVIAEIERDLHQKTVN